MNKYLQDRTERQRQERQCLARYALFSSDAQGRRHPEPEHPYRTCFQRDRDRIIHCAAFRRLEAKTQVFLDVRDDYYRTRLTHTIEVAQIARTMARALRVNEDLTEAVALAHDLGHPPYGHAGETVLDNLTAGEGGFEHNRHSLRIVEYLEHPYPSFRGLNLTYETRQCLAGHETRCKDPKLLAEYGSAQPPLEGQIADLADAIAYNSHDLDDALTAGLIDEQDLSGLELYQVAREKTSSQFPQAQQIARQLRSAKAIIELLIVDALHESARRLEQADPQTVDDIRRHETRLIGLSPTRHSQMALLQVFLSQRVYQHPRVASARRRACDILEFLFAAYLADPALLPRRYQQRIAQQGQKTVVCDYLAGMTDRFCLRQYRRLGGSLPPDETTPVPR